MLPRSVTNRLGGVAVRPLAKRVSAGGTLVNVAVGLAVALLGFFVVQPIVVVSGVLVVAGSTVIAPVLARFLVALLGILLLFQNEAVGGTEKIIFVLAAGIFSAIALARVLGSSRNFTALQRRVIRLALIGAAMFALVPAASLLQLVASGATVDAWFRDGVSYFLIPMTILIGIDAGLSLRPQVIFAATLAVSALGGTSSLVTWLGRRGGSDLGFSQFGLASSFTVFAGIALCLALYFNGARLSILWLFGALVLIGLLVSTGGRQPAIYAALAILTAAVTGSGSFLARLLRVGVAALGAALMLSVIFAFSQTYGGGIAARRLDFFSRVADQGWGVVNNDGSVLDRANAYTWTLEIWLAQPLTGRGLGVAFPSVRSGSTADGGFTLDTPLIVLAKFGVIGTLVLCIAFLLIFVAMGRATTFSQYRPLGRITFAATSGMLLLATVLNGFPTENRGLPVFMMLLVAVGLSTVGLDRDLDEPVVTNSMSRPHQNDVRQGAQRL